MNTRTLSVAVSTWKELRSGTNGVSVCLVSSVPSRPTFTCRSNFTIYFRHFVDLQQGCRSCLYQVTRNSIFGNAFLIYACVEMSDVFVSSFYISYIPVACLIRRCKFNEFCALILSVPVLKYLRNTRDVVSSRISSESHVSLTYHITAHVTV